MTTQTTIDAIKASPVYQQVMKDSIGGLMYDMGKLGTYDAAPVLALWDTLTPAEQDNVGGIMKGAISFLKGDI